jgi:hypothetical protein
MWTCPKCGEEIEDQFDSCWKCSERSAEPAVSRPSGKDYFTAFLIAYFIPWLAICIQSATAHWRTAILPGRDQIAPALVWGLVPAVINFLVLLPFLKSPALSRLIAGLLFVSWTLFFVSFRAAVVK